MFRVDEDNFLRNGEEYFHLHQFGYASFFRNEDESNIFITSCYHLHNETKIRTFEDKNNKMNRSNRRESSAIYFWNEDDSEIYSMNFSQHKGFIMQEFLPVYPSEVVYLFGYELANELYKKLLPNCYRCEYFKQPKRRKFCHLTGNTIKELEEDSNCDNFILRKEFENANLY